MSSKDEAIEKGNLISLTNLCQAQDCLLQQEGDK